MGIGAGLLASQLSGKCNDTATLLNAFSQGFKIADQQQQQDDARAAAQQQAQAEADAATAQQQADAAQQKAQSNAIAQQQIAIANQEALNHGAYLFDDAQYGKLLLVMGNGIKSGARFSVSDFNALDFTAIKTTFSGRERFFFTLACESQQQDVLKLVVLNENGEVVAKNAATKPSSGIGIGFSPVWPKVTYDQYFEQLTRRRWRTIKIDNYDSKNLKHLKPKTIAANRQEIDDLCQRAKNGEDFRALQKECADYTALHKLYEDYLVTNQLQKSDSELDASYGLGPKLSVFDTFKLNQVSEVNVYALEGYDGTYDFSKLVEITAPTNLDEAAAMAKADLGPEEEGLKAWNTIVAMGNPTQDTLDNVNLQKRKIAVDKYLIAKKENPENSAAKESGHNNPLPPGQYTLCAYIGDTLLKKVGFTIIGDAQEPVHLQQQAQQPVQAPAALPPLPKGAIQYQDPQYGTVVIVTCNYYQNFEGDNVVHCPDNYVGIKNYFSTKERISVYLSTGVSQTGYGIKVWNGSGNLVNSYVETNAPGGVCFNSQPKTASALPPDSYMAAFYHDNHLIKKISFIVSDN